MNRTVIYTSGWVGRDGVVLLRKKAIKQDEECGSLARKSGCWKALNQHITAEQSRGASMPESIALSSFIRPVFVTSNNAFSAVFFFINFGTDFSEKSKSI